MADNRVFNLQELRGILSDEIDKIREGTSTAATCNAVTNATGKLLSTIKLELEYCKLLGKVPNIPMLSLGDGDKKGA